MFQLLKPDALEKCFAGWFSSLQDVVRGVIAIDCKTLRGSKTSANGDGALHIVPAYACEAGLVIGQRATEKKSNEITAIPELLDMLAVKAGIVPIDAMGTQKAIAANIVAKEADYILALKGNQTALHGDVKLFSGNPELAWNCAFHETADCGHGRIEVRMCQTTNTIDWLRKLHPEWKNLRCIAAITSTRTIKKTGKSSAETRFYISSLPAEPAVILAATRAHWGMENNLHGQSDITFDEDHCRTRKDFSPLNFALIRHAVLNMLRRDETKISLKRKRIKAAVNPAFRTGLPTC